MSSAFPLPRFRPLPPPSSGKVPVITTCTPTPQPRWNVQRRCHEIMIEIIEKKNCSSCRWPSRFNLSSDYILFSHCSLLRQSWWHEDTLLSPISRVHSYRMSSQKVLCFFSWSWRLEMWAMSSQTRRPTWGWSPRNHSGIKIGGARISSRCYPFPLYQAWG